MRDVSPIEKLVKEKESDTIGGMVVCIWGEQGAGKTMMLTKMVMKDMGLDHVEEDYSPDKTRRIPLWKGQETCQWILLAAQGLPVTLWMHDSIKNYKAYLTGSKKRGLERTEVNLEEKQGLDIEIKNYGSQEELVRRLDADRVNVYYIPGSKGGEKDKYFYQQKNYELDKALNNRSYGDHITLNRDEVSNEASTFRKGDFYELQEFKLPQEWEDFRKNKISMRGAGHSTTDVNYKLHKVKATGTVYMQGADVHSRHREIDQGAVNSMKRGEFVVPGFQPGTVELPKLPHQVFDWMPETNDVRLRLDIESDIPDIRPKEKDVEQWIDSQPFDKEDLDDMIDLKEAADLTGMARNTLQKKIYKNEVKAVKLRDNHWILSMTQLLNNQDIPIAES